MTSSQRWFSQALFCLHWSTGRAIPLFCARWDFDFWAALEIRRENEHI
jgi:hypothetical protein